MTEIQPDNLADCEHGLPEGASIVEPGLVEMPQPPGIFAGVLFDRAEEYLNAVQRLQNQDEKADLYVCYFLATHAVELLLKAFLAVKGSTKRDLREAKIRHNLPSLLEHAIAMGLAAPQDFSELVNVLHNMNDRHDFRYPTGYQLHLPPPLYCLDVIRPVGEVIGKITKVERVEAHVEWAGATRHLKGFKIRWSD